jgi:carbamoyl-phosphate synthase large subunit
MAHKLNILFTCAGRRVVLLRLFRQAMDALGVQGKLIAADATWASAAYHAADVGLALPKVQTVEYIAKLLEACRTHKIGLVIPLTDLDLRSLARHKQEFQAIGCEPMIGSPEAVLACRDKLQTVKFLRQAGLKFIRALTLEEFRREPFFPCFIKPVRGSASVGIGILHSEAELKAHLSAFGEKMIIQDYVPGSEFTLDIFRTRDGQVPCVVPRQRLSIRAGEVEKGLTVSDPALIEDGVKLGKAMEGAWGVFNAQCRRNAKGESFFFEINLRFGGGAPLSVAAGADLPRYVLEERLGLPVSAKLGKFKPNLLMLRYDDAVFVDVRDPASLPGYDNPSAR